jgi:hypothetical protein
LWNDPTHDIGEHWFESSYRIGDSGVDEDVLADRMHFVCDPEGAPIATTTAWFADNDPASLGGVVHNVAIKSSHDGRGLSKPLLAAVLLRMRELGHVDCQLGTSTGASESVRNLAHLLCFFSSSFSVQTEFCLETIRYHDTLGIGNYTSETIEGVCVAQRVSLPSISTPGLASCPCLAPLWSTEPGVSSSQSCECRLWRRSRSTRTSCSRCSQAINGTSSAFMASFLSPRNAGRLH